MIKTLKEAIEARDKFPGRVRIVREVRWYAYVDSIGHYLTQDWETEEITRYIDAKKAEEAKEYAIAIKIPPELAELGPFDPDSPQSRIANDALDRVSSLTLEERMKKVDERIAIKSVPPFGPIK